MQQAAAATGNFETLAQAILDGQARRDDEESARELLAVGAVHGVDGLPRDEHGHDRGLARAGGELQRQTAEFGIGLGVGLDEMVEEALAALARLRGDLGEPDRGFDRLDLTEERVRHCPCHPLLVFVAALVRVRVSRSAPAMEAPVQASNPDCQVLQIFPHYSDAG